MVGEDTYLEHKNQHYVFKEPIFSAEWEAKYLMNLANIDKKYSIKYYHRYKNTINKDQSYYLYNYRKKSLTYISN